MESLIFLAPPPPPPVSQKKHTFSFTFSFLVFLETTTTIGEEKKKDVCILPRSIRRISFLFDGDDELATFAEAFGAARVIDEDIFVLIGNPIQKWESFNRI